MPSVARRPGGRIIGLFALSLMERSGPIHGYGLGQAITERTRGSWRPGPGAIYPALARLEDRKLARAKRVGRQRVYSISPEGRRLLRSVRRRFGPHAEAMPDLTALWSEVAGMPGVGDHLIFRLRRTVDHLNAWIDQAEPAEQRRIRGELRRTVRPRFDRAVRGTGRR